MLLKEFTPFNKMKNILILILIFFSCALSLFSERAFAQTNPLVILKDMGFNTIYEGPIKFELPDLHGSLKKLDDYRGQWVWLTFWATWCGPCAYEMPMLESLHQEFKDKGLTILGVSVDQGDAILLKKYVKEKDITFPVLHDQNSSVSSQYQASAIPSIYVISPDGKLVGIFRGANNWENSTVIQNLQKLLKIKKISAADSAAFAKASNNTNSQESSSLKLPNDLVPPILEILPHKGEVELKKTIELEVRVKWKGDPRQYLLQAPKLIVPNGVKVGQASSYSQNNHEEAELYFVFPLTFEKEGTYTIGPVEVSYQTRSGSQEQYSRGKEVEIKAINPMRKKYGRIIFLGLIMILSLAGLIYKRKKLTGQNIWSLGRKKSSPVQTEMEIEKKREKWVKIQRLKVSSSRKEYEVELLRFHQEIMKETDDQNGGHPQKIEQLLEEIRFAGKELTMQEILFYEKNIEKQFNL